MPCAVIVGIEVSNNTIRKLNQGKAEECPLWVSTPVHIGSGRLFAAGTARVVGPHAPGGIVGADLGGSAVDRLGTEFGQRHAGVGAVGPVNGKGQLIAEVAQSVILGFVLRPVVVLPVGHSIQSIAVQLCRVTLGPADAHHLTGLADHQSLTAGHCFFLEQS